MNFARHQARDERRPAGHQNDLRVDAVLVEKSPFLRDPEAEGAAGNRRSADIDMHRRNRRGGLPRAKQSDKQKCVGNLADKRSFAATHPALNSSLGGEMQAHPRAGSVLICFLKWHALAFLLPTLRNLDCSPLLILNII